MKTSRKTKRDLDKLLKRCTPNKSLASLSKHNYVTKLVLHINRS